MHLSLLDGAVFTGYFLLVIVLGFWVASRDKEKSAQEYFLARNKLPWYAVGASFIASNISTEHFIGMVGWSFLYGFVVAHWEWMNFISFSMLIWIFLPFYMRGNVSTMPEFLERRYNRACRTIYAIVSIIGMVIAMLGAVMYAGGEALNALFPKISVGWGILLIAITSSAYTIYGGQLSVAWTDFMQYCLLLIGGAVVTGFCLYYVEDPMAMVAAMPEKFIMFFPPTHEMIPWTGLVAGLFSVGIWYSCANQFMVQRCLGARSEWDARMGIVMAGFSKAVMPLLVVLPGIIAFYMFHDQLNNGDQSWPLLVRSFLPSGLIGLVMAGLASAIMSTVSAILNSSATILTIDVYQPLINPKADDRRLRWVGRLSGVIVMIIGTVIALILTKQSTPVFTMIQTVFFYIAAPIAAIFLIGILWPRATPAAATLTLVVGFALIPIVKFGLFELPAFKPYNAFSHHTFVIFVISCLVLVIVSLFTRPKPREDLRGVIWTKAALGTPKEEREINRGWRSLGLWWTLMVITFVVLYGYAMTRSSHARWFEAEALATQAVGGHVRIQERDEVAKHEKNFALWTGAKQILFEAAQPEGRVRFELAVSKAGRYEISAIVTSGPEYVPFRAFVNGQPTKIGWHETVQAKSGKRFRLMNRQADILPGQPAPGTTPNGEKTPRLHTVNRISLGKFDLQSGFAQVALQAVRASSDRSAIGVDQWILTPVKGQ